MSLRLMYITNREDIANLAEKSGVDWIFVDLEIIGKHERQGHLDTVISHHTIEDVQKIRRVLTKAGLLVRINPIHEHSLEEIHRVIDSGADIVMLPFFMNRKEVQQFVDAVAGKAKTCLLFETAEAVENIDDILEVEGIDFVHIGLNDLHIAYKMGFMFELLANGTVELLCNKFRKRGIPYGFGGIAQLGHGDVPAEVIISEHYRLGSSAAILSRSFCNTSKIDSLHEIERIFEKGIRDIREFEMRLTRENLHYFNHNLTILKSKVYEKKGIV